MKKLAAYVTLDLYNRRECFGMELFKRPGHAFRRAEIALDDLLWEPGRLRKENA